LAGAGVRGLHPRLPPEHLVSWGRGNPIPIPHHTWRLRRIGLGASGKSNPLPTPTLTSPSHAFWTHPWCSQWQTR